MSNNRQSLAHRPGMRLRAALSWEVGGRSWYQNRTHVSHEFGPGLVFCNN